MTARASAIDLDQLADLREEKGLTFAQISAIVGRSPGAVAWQCLKHNIDSPRTLAAARARPHNTGTMICGAGDQTIRRFTAAEDADLLRLEATGMSYGRIARTMGRAGSSIRGRLLTLARRDERGL